MRLIDADALVDAVKDRIDEDKEIYPDDKSSIIFRAGMRTVIGIVKNQDTLMKGKLRSLRAQRREQQKFQLRK